MVGVPRSKGCRICVQRRVKCDQARPFCKNCKKGNRPCPGYGQDMKFQDEGPKLRQRYQNKFADDGDDEDIVEFPNAWADLSSSSSSSGSAHASPAASANWDGLGLEAKKSRRLPIFALLSNPERGGEPGDDDKDEQYYEETNHKAMVLGRRKVPYEEQFNPSKIGNFIYAPDGVQNQLLSLFASSMIPPDQPSILPEMRNRTRWLLHLPPRAGTNLLLDTSVRAVTLAHLGRQLKSSVMVNESRPYYGKALRLLNAALLDEVQGMASETLSATILLSFYEMFSSESDESWVRHAGGAGTLMRIRGASRHRYGFDREIYLSYRHALVIEAFQKDIPCFLAEPDWVELSHQIHEDLRSTGSIGEQILIFDSAEEFFLEMAQIPGLVHSARNIPALAATHMNGDAAAAKDHIRSKALERRANLKAIFARFSSALRNIGHGPTSYVSGDPVIPIYYNYVNVFVASSHSGYWTLLIVLNILLFELDRDGPSSSLYAVENREAALDCCRSAPYMESFSFLGAFFVIFALRLSLVVLEPKKEREWVVKKLFHIGNTNMSMAKHLPESGVTNSMPLVRSSVEKIDRLVRGGDLSGLDWTQAD